MKRIIIGTAGHVDHGKTCLTKALTGVDTDRLKEEQKRGITIEIGFAQLTLANGQTASIVDVPGHEKLIRNMLVGATGIDVVLLVVAADEGFMPQTREHLDILSLLEVKTGLIVITKTDMVDGEWLDAVMEDTRQNVKGSFLEAAPMLPVSAHTGAGIAELKAQILALVSAAPSRPNDRPFRLPVDRAFSIKGFGTVVTGTLVDGVIRTGDNVTVYPGGHSARVRELQNHDTKQAEVTAGMRVAINLSGVDKKDLSRGCIIAQPDSMLLSRQISVRLQLTPDAAFRVKNSSQLHFYTGTQERVCKLRLLDADELGPGESGYAQLAFDEELPARCLDRFIVRFFSPMTTVGGGLILDMKPKRLKRKAPATIARLDALAGPARARVLQLVQDHGAALLGEDDMLLTSGLAAGELRAAIAALRREGAVVAIKNGLIAQTTLDALWLQAETLLAAYHQEQSLSAGMHLGELREKLFSAAPRDADAILGYFQQQGRLRLDGSCAALADFQSAFTPEQAAMGQELERYYLDCGFEPPLNSEATERFGSRPKLFAQVLNRMIKDGVLVAVNAQTTAHKTCCDRALAVFVAMFADSDTVTLADYRTALGVSRKYAQLFLEYFDSRKISRLVGDKRVLLAPGKTEGAANNQAPL